MRLYHEHASPDRIAVVSTLVFSPDSNSLVSGSLDGSVVLYDSVGPCQSLDHQADFDSGSARLFPGLAYVSHPRMGVIPAGIAFLDNETLARGGKEGLYRYVHYDDGWRFHACYPFRSDITALGTISPRLLAVASGEPEPATPGMLELYDIQTRQTRE